MAVTAKWYGPGYLNALSKKIDLLGDDVRLMLLKSSYTPDQDHAFVSDVNPASNEASGLGYTAGGLALASKTLAYDAATNTTKFGAANPTWTGATFTARYGVYHDRSPATDATRPLLCYVDFGADVVVNVGTFVIDTSAGIATLTPA